MKVNQEALEVTFKSCHENWVKEASGDKPYTVRTLTAEEWTEIKKLEGLAIKDSITIVLIDADTGEDIRRQVTDITVLKEGLGHYDIGIAFKTSYAAEKNIQR